MKIIADVGDPVYYQQRACEIIKSVTGNTKSLRTAISLLALSIAEIESTERDVPVEDIRKFL